MMAGRPLMPCGTVAAYRRHLRHGETPCDACREVEYLRGRKGRPKRPLEPCGTRAAYERHRRAGEPACEACLRANTVAVRDGRIERSTRPGAEIPHGLNGYVNWLCRCEICQAAKSEHNRHNRARREA